MRGPMVFCVEGADVPDGKVNDLVLADEGAAGKRVSQRPAGRSAGRYWRSQTRSGESLQFTAIPYHAWANRGKGEMVVWLARTPNVAEEKED